MAAGTACRKRPRRQGGGHAPKVIVHRKAAAIGGFAVANC